MGKQKNNEEGRADKLFLFYILILVLLIFVPLVLYLIWN